MEILREQNRPIEDLRGVGVSLGKLGFEGGNSKGLEGYFKVGEKEKMIEKGKKVDDVLKRAFGGDAPPPAEERRVEFCLTQGDYNVSRSKVRRHDNEERNDEMTTHEYSF